MMIFKVLDNELNVVGMKDFRYPYIKASDWIRKETKSIRKNEISPNISSSIVVSDSDKKTAKNSLGSINNDSNNVAENLQNIFICSSVSSRNANIPILAENINKVVALFTARKIIKRNWINDKDEYSKPNETL